MCVGGLFPLFRGRYAYIFPLTYHEGAIQTIYMPHCHVEIYFIELLYRYPCRILKRYINRRYSHFFYCLLSHLVFKLAGDSVISTVTFD